MKKGVLDYIDFEKINLLLEGFNKSTGFVTAILDLEGNILSKSGWRHICTNFHRVNTLTNKNCMISDTQLANMNKDNEFNIYKCRNGLVDVSVPIIIDGEHVANLFTGQFFFEKPDESFFIKQAETYGFDKEIYINALKDVPIVTEKQVKDIVKYLLNITDIIINLTSDRIIQENLKTLLESSLESPKGISISSLDCEYRYLYFNKEYFKRMKENYNIDIKVGDLIFDLITDEKDTLTIKNNLDTALSGKQHTIFEQFGNHNISYYETKFGPIYNQLGEVIGVTVFSENITNRVSLEHRLLAEKQVSELTLLSVGDGVITTDTDGKITLMNRVAEFLTGWKSEDAIGKNIEKVFAIYNDKTEKKCDNIVYKVVNLGVTQELANHTILYSLDGKKRPIADSASPIKHENGEIIGVIIVFRDYSEKYEKERTIERLVHELSDSKILLESSLESPKDIIIISLDREYKYLFFNKAHRIDMKNAYGMDVHVGDCIFDFMTSKDDIKRIKDNYDLTLSGVTHISLEKYGDIEANFYETNFNPIRNPNGEVIGLTAFSQNVTASVNLKTALIKNEKRYRGLVDNLDSGVVIHAADTSILSCNKKASELLGISMDALTGKYAFDSEFSFINEDSTKMLLEDYPVNLIIQNKEPLKGKVLGIVRALSNDIVWVSASGIPVFDTKESISEIVISFIDITEAKKNRSDLEFSAYRDYLTGLYNRRHYEENLAKYDHLDNYPLTMVMADINGLKLINDAFGHHAGDELLISAANIITESCRETDCIARIGGDEFVIVMPNSSGKDAEKVIEKINMKAKSIFIESIELSISFGFATKSDRSEDIQEVYRSAEDLMYRTKLIEIPSMRSGAIGTILNTLNEKDKNSEIHSRHVSEISEKIALACNMNRQEVNEIKTAGLLHDIGKIIIPISIIIKEGKLSSEEYRLIKTHPEIGFRILNSTHDMRSLSEFVLNHHERWDGKGYPRGIKADKIPLQSRIIAIADAFDAMTSERTYRDVFTNEEALHEIIKNAGTQFDPELVKIFKENFTAIIGNIHS